MAIITSIISATLALVLLLGVENRSTKIWTAYIHTGYVQFHSTTLVLCLQWHFHFWANDCFHWFCMPCDKLCRKASIRVSQHRLSKVNYKTPKISIGVTSFENNKSNSTTGDSDKLSSTGAVSAQNDN